MKISYPSDSEGRAAPLSLDEIINQIERHYHGPVLDLLAVSKYCGEADRRFEKRSSDRKKLLNSLPFSRPEFSKFVKIGRNKHLHSKEKTLPAKFSILYELSKLADEELDHAIAEHVVHPSMKRAELLAWIRERRGEPKKARRPRIGTDRPSNLSDRT